MSDTSRTGSASAFQGFSVSQPAIGASLEWLPAMGTPELDELIHAFLPGPSPIQTKRTHISMDFFQYVHQTGETFKFYPVCTAHTAFFGTATSSPATSSMYDSGYNSSFNVSPVVPDVQDKNSPSQSPAPFSTASSSRQSTVDISSHPGMRIMTKDGQDVTNSLSRGCKTKEQREHAHLMRLMKACPSCKKKKVKCDPSHKRRTASRTSAITSGSRSVKKTQSASPPAAQPPPVKPNPSTVGSSDLLDGNLGLEPTLQNIDMLFDQFIQYDDDQFVQYPTGLEATQPFNDVFHDPRALHMSSFGSGSPLAWPSQVFTPYDTSTPMTPAPPGLLPSHVSPAGPNGAAPTLPYLNPGEPHGTNYVDFNLFSSTSDFLDEELQLARARPPAVAPRRGDSPGELSDPGAGGVAASGRHLQYYLEVETDQEGMSSLVSGAPAGQSRHPPESSWADLQSAPQAGSRTLSLISHWPSRADDHGQRQMNHGNDRHAPGSDSFGDQLVASWQSPRDGAAACESYDDAGQSVRVGSLDRDRGGSFSTAPKHRPIFTLGDYVLGLVSMVLLFCGSGCGPLHAMACCADCLRSILPVLRAVVVDVIWPLAVLGLLCAAHAAEDDQCGNASVRQTSPRWPTWVVGTAGGVLCRTARRSRSPPHIGQSLIHL